MKSMKQRRRTAALERLADAFEVIAGAQADQARAVAVMMGFWNQITPLIIVAANRDLARTEKAVEVEDEDEDE